MKKKRDKFQPLRIYADTSVFGGVFDEEFINASREFFDLVRAGRFHLVTSTVVADELEQAPHEVGLFFREILPTMELIEITPESLQIQRAYLLSKVVTHNATTDALHVALATVSGCAIIVSWNFKHIVNFKRIRMYNAVNLLQGYRTIAIHSPLEVIYED